MSGLFAGATICFCTGHNVVGAVMATTWVIVGLGKLVNAAK